MKQGIYKQLHLLHLEAALPQVLSQARTEQWTYETFLERALGSEVEGREQKALARRLKAARIPAKKTLDGFEFAFQPSLSERRLRELADLSLSQLSHEGASGTAGARSSGVELVGVGIS